MELNGTVALVTGAARGIGKAIAEGLARRGARVALADVLDRELRETAGQIQQTGATALAVRTDITDHGQVQAMAGKVRQELGPVDILVNNAGSLSALGPVWEVDAQRWARDVTVNLIGTFFVTRAVVGDMVERRRGYIISLVGAGVDAPHLYTTGYDTSKAGVVRLTEALAREAGEFGIKTFTLSPGTVLTKMTEFIRDSDQGRRWRPQFKEYLDRTGGMPADLAVQACLKILSGAADALSGRWLSATRDFNDYVSQSDTIVSENLLALRLRPLH